MAPFGRGFRTELVPVTSQGRPAASEVRAPGLCELTTFSRAPGAVIITLIFGGGAQGSERPSHWPKVTQLRRDRGGMGTRVSRAPLQRLFEDTRYLPIVTLRNKTGSPHARFHLKQCSTQICVNKSNQKSASGFRPARPAGQLTPPAAAGRAGAVPT